MAIPLFSPVAVAVVDWYSIMSIVVIIQRSISAAKRVYRSSSDYKGAAAGH